MDNLLGIFFCRACVDTWVEYQKYRKFNIYLFSQKSQRVNGGMAVIVTDSDFSPSAPTLSRTSPGERLALITARHKP
jgi:hypothetical protein